MTTTNPNATAPRLSSLAEWRITLGQLVGSSGLRNTMTYKVKGSEPNIRAWAQDMCDHKSNTSCDIRYARSQLFLVCQRWGYTMDHLNPPQKESKRGRRNHQGS